MALTVPKRAGREARGKGTELGVRKLGLVRFRRVTLATYFPFASRVPSEKAEQG